MKILFISDSTVSSVIRQQIPGESIQRTGKHQVFIANAYSLSREALSNADMYCFIRPTKGITDIIKYVKDNFKGKILVDQDDCFDYIPKSHIAYNTLGPGNPAQKLATFEAMQMADYVTVSTETLKEYYGDRCIVIPNGWTKRNKAWESEFPHDGVILGFAGTITHREDFKVAKQPILDIMKKYPETKIVIGNDLVIYEQFKNIPENRKLFIPMLPYSVYPSLIRLLDIVIVPLVNDKFNRYKSDIKLMEAGVARRPFVASSVYSYDKWKVGGFVTNDQGFFYSSIECLLKEEARDYYSNAGNKFAQEREMDTLIETTWLKIIEDACLTK